MKSISIISVLFFVFSSCSMLGTKDKIENLDEISSRKKSQQFEYEKFYETAPINKIKLSSDQSVVYFLKKDGVDNIYKYDLKTKKIKALTKYKEKVNDYLVGPKGRYLYIQKDVGGSEIYDLFQYDLKLNKTKQITFGKGKKPSYLCAISADGNQLYYSQSFKMWGNSEIKEYRLSNKKHRTILESNKSTWYCADSLSEDGSKLGLTRFIHNNEIHAGYLDINTKEPHLFSSDEGIKNYNVTFHKNNVYYLSTKDSNFSRVWKYSSSEKNSELVDLGYKNDIEFFEFQKDKKHITVQYRGELNSAFDVYSGAFDNKISFSDKKFQKYLSGAVYGKDTKVLITSTAHIPEQYYIQSNGNSALFYDSNQSGILNDEFTMSRSLFIKSFDGTKVPAHFYIPNGTNNKNKRPAILMIHGGPEDHYDATYSAISQYWANRGFVVVTPNVRGSTGFGKKYQFMDNNDWGGGHVKDIIATANFTKKLDFVDENNVFLVGGSFGGFSVMSTITQYPNIFKAAVNIFGPIEFKSFIGSLPKMAQDYFIGELGFDPKNDEKRNKAVSPLFHVKNIKIPLQVHQGVNDKRVPKWQSDLLVKEIKKNGINVDYVVYPDEGHGFTKFKNSKKCFTSISDFFKDNTTL